MHGLISRRCLAHTGIARGFLLSPHVPHWYSLSTVAGSHVTADQDGRATPSPSSVADELPRLGRVLGEALKATAPRSDWTKDEIREVYNTPLLDLVHYSVCIYSTFLFSVSPFLFPEYPIRSGS